MASLFQKFGPMGSFWKDNALGTQSKFKPYNSGSLDFLSQLFEGGGLQDSELYGSGSNFLQSLLSGGPEAFQQFEAPLMQNFEQNIIPKIAERFGGMGTGAGASSSSALYNSLGQAGRNLQTDLGALRGGLQMQALPQALGYAQSPILNALQAAQSTPGQYYERPGKKGFWDSFLPMLSQAGRGMSGGF